MVPLPTVSFLLTNELPDGYDWGERDMSSVSSTTAFDVGIDLRDIFLGERCCVVCGVSDGAILQHCHIIKDSDKITWLDLKNHGWIPAKAKACPEHEPRNGFLLCANHHIAFNAHLFFIRFFPDTSKFVFINYSNRPSFEEFHGKAIGLNIVDDYVPFPALFLVHETLVRGFQPFQPTSPDMPDGTPWQAWILSNGVLDEASGSFIRHRPPVHGKSKDDHNNHNSAQGEPVLPLNEGIVAEILAVTHTMPSWKACIMEGSSWEGTAEDNIQKYTSIFKSEPEQ